MNVSRSIALWVALSVVCAAGAAAQGRSSQRPTKPTTVSKGAPKNPHAAGKRPDRPSHDSPRTEKSRTIAANIAKNPQLEARLTAMLPAGMTLEQASDGFRNQGQFIAALEASKNQNIPFAQLKTEMTGNDPLSLGQAIQKLKPATEPAS